MSLPLSPADEVIVLSIPLFEDIDKDSVLALIDGAAQTSHPKGGLLFSKGDPADRFFLVLAGRVSLFALTKTGDHSLIEVIDTGHSFAEGAIFASQRFPLNAEVAEGTRLLEIAAQSFLRRLSERPGLTAKLLASLARWQRRLLTEIGDLKSRSPVQRLGLFLLAQVQPQTEGSEIHLHLTKRQLASRIGITPESLSRAMARLRPLGVSTKGRDFVLSDPEALRKFCGDD